MMGCRKDFLNETPRVQTPDDYFNSNTNAAQELVTAIYSKLYDWQQHGFSWIGITSIASDEGEKGSDPGDTGSDKDQMDKLSWSPTAISFGEVWESNFEGIARANKAIDLLPTIDIGAAQRDQLIGESRFLRAYFYWNLVRSFGGVPLIPKVPKTAAEIEALNYRATADQIYDFIDADLEFAAATLPASQLSTQTGRVTSGAAKALLAKSSLYRKRYGKAESLCAEIIASNTYSLYADYSKLFREVGEFCSESIWEINCKSTAPAKAIEGYFVVQAPRGTGVWGGDSIPQQPRSLRHLKRAMSGKRLLSSLGAMCFGMDMFATMQHPMHTTATKAMYPKPWKVGETTIGSPTRIYAFCAMPMCY